MSERSGFLGLTDVPERLRRQAKILSLMMVMTGVSFSLSSTFYLIFIAEALGGGSYIEGLALVAILVGTMMGVQILLDYPTGGLGDYIGHRYSLACAYFIYAVAYFATSIVTATTPFHLLVLIYVLMGVAMSQQSGALMSWFDNNYRIAAPNDQDRTQYGVVLGRTGMLFSVASTLIMVPGGIAAAILGRPWVFQLQAVICVAIAVTALNVMQDSPELKTEKLKKAAFREYTSLLKDGIRFLWSDPFVTYVVVGGTLALSVMFVWGSLILFPFYFLYLVTDVAVAGFRTVLFVPSVAAEERSGVWSKGLDPKKWIPRFRLGQLTGFGFFGALGMLMIFFPPPANTPSVVDLTIPFTQFVLLQIPEASIIPLFLMIIVFTFGSFCFSFANVLTQRIMLDIIPNRIRNSMYSLQATIANLFAIPMIVLFGWMVPTLGFLATLLCLAIIALFAVFLIKKGLSYPVPSSTGAKATTATETATCDTETTMCE